MANEQRLELQRLTRPKGIAPSTRDPVEMIRRSDAGWSVPRIAHHLGQHHQTVRAWIKAFLHVGFDALPNRLRGGKHSLLTFTMIETVRAEVARCERTWTAAQLTGWVTEQHGVRLSTDRMRVHLRRAKISWQRTSLKCAETPSEDEEWYSQHRLPAWGCRQHIYRSAQSIQHLLHDLLRPWTHLLAPA